MQIQIRKFRQGVLNKNKTCYSFKNNSTNYLDYENFLEAKKYYKKKILKWAYLLFGSDKGTQKQIKVDKDR